MGVADERIEMLGGHHRIHGVDDHFLRTLHTGMAGHAPLIDGDGDMMFDALSRQTERIRPS